MTDRKRTWRRRAGLLLGALAALAALALFASHRISAADQEHARFYNTGKTINAFLKEYCQGLEAARAAGDPAPLAGLYSPRYRAPGRGRWAWSAGRSESEVRVLELRREGGETYGPEALSAELQAYLGGFAAIDQSICKIDLIEETDLERRALLTVKLYLDGVDPEGRLFQDRVFQRWELANEHPGEETGWRWRIVRDELVEGVRVIAEEQRFVAVEPAALGIDFEHRRDPRLDMKKYAAELRFGVIQHASGGVSAADIDGDGRPDLLFADGERARLYRHLGPGDDGLPRYADVTAETGLGTVGAVHSGFIVDVDNDGRRDIFLARYLAPCRFFHNQGPGAGGLPAFRERSAEMGLDFTAPSVSATFLDYDRDGFVDLYVSATGHAFEAFPRLPFSATNGGVNRLLKNDGGRRFVDVTAESGTGDRGWSLAVAAADVDGDGWPDLGVANDFGRKSLYRNEGDGTFREVAKEAGVLDFSGGMGLAFGDLDDDGRLDLYTSNINSNQRWFGEDMTVTQYMRNVLRTRWALLDLGEYWNVYRLLGSDWVELGQQIGEGNSVFLNAGNRGGLPSFTEVKDSRADRAGWSWSVALFDYDNDADLDLYAANGWISNTPGTDL